MAKEKKSYYKSKKEKEYEAAQSKTASVSSLSAVPEKRRHVVYKHEDGTNINIYESYNNT
jgi:hypothetical protein